MKRFALIILTVLSLMLMTSCSFFQKQEPAKEVPLNQTKPNANNNTYNTYNNYYGGTSGSPSSAVKKSITKKKYIAPKKKTVYAEKTPEYHADDWYFHTPQQPVYSYVPVQYTPPVQPHSYNTYDAVGAFNYAN